MEVGVGSIAQRLEQGTHNPLVPGSNPGGPTALSSYSPVLLKFIHQLWAGLLDGKKILEEGKALWG